ncbi:MAG TPA: polyphosphate kinase 2 [Vicinamibacterales bacterium]|nr:polyphosphate kinase 2 [Vicinamibacterales bacterium]
MSKLKRKEYEPLLETMQAELNNLARWLKSTGTRMLVLIEGRDTAGKGGVIRAITDALNPRQVRTVALAKPSERERTEWYFQRYVAHLPAAGEMVLLDRSWYNRAGVEKVMGYCTSTEYERFLKQTPMFERMLVDDGILLFKYWLTVDQDRQEERFAERASDPMKRWKLSPIDLEARARYVEYGQARDAMFEATHTAHAPWVAVDFNDQRRGRLNLIRHLLDHTPDVTLPSEPLELTPLGGEPHQDEFNGPVKPIPNKY